MRLLAIQLSREGRELGELLLHHRIIDIERAPVARLPMRVFLREIACHCIQVGLGIANRGHVRHPQHAQVHFLRELGGIRVLAYPARQEGLQGAALLREQPFQQRFLYFGH